jgi:hypothetical protein
MYKSQSRILDRPAPSVDRPPCPKCDWPMWSICIGPADEPDHYKRTFECPHCEHQKVVVVKYD